MTPDEVLALAQEGNPKILTAILNRSTRSHGIDVRVAQKQGCLHILLEGEAIASSRSLLTFIEGSLTKLNVNPDLPVKVYGRRRGQRAIAWSQELHRQHHPHPSSTSDIPTSVHSTDIHSTDAHSSVTVNSSSDPFSDGTLSSIESSVESQVNAYSPSNRESLEEPSPQPEESITLEESIIPEESVRSEAIQYSTEATDSVIPPQTETPAPPLFQSEQWDIDPWTSPVGMDIGTDDAHSSQSEPSASILESFSAESPQTDTFQDESLQPERSSAASDLAESELSSTELPPLESLQPEPLQAEPPQAETAQPEAFDSPEMESVPTPPAQAEPSFDGVPSAVDDVERETSLSSEELVLEDTLATMDQPNTIGAIASDQPAEANSANDTPDSSMETNTPEMVDTPIADTPIDDADLFEEQDESFNFQDMMQRPEALVVILFAIALYIWQLYNALVTKAAPEGSVSGQELADRLGVSKSTVSRRKLEPDFSEWSASQDPDGIAWAYESGAFVPQMPDFSAS